MRHHASVGASYKKTAASHLHEVSVLPNVPRPHPHPRTLVRIRSPTYPHTDPAAWRYTLATATLLQDSSTPLGPCIPRSCTLHLLCWGLVLLRAAHAARRHSGTCPHMHMPLMIHTEGLVQLLHTPQLLRLHWCWRCGKNSWAFGPSKEVIAETGVHQLVGPHQPLTRWLLLSTRLGPLHPAL